MSMEDTLDLKSEGERCVVCGKNVEQGRGLAHIKHGEAMVALCCPLCMETFKQDPERYTAKDRVRRTLRGE